MKFSDRSLGRIQKAVKDNEEGSEDAGLRPVHVVHNPTPLMTCVITDGPAVTNDPYQGYLTIRINRLTWENGDVKVWVRPSKGTKLTVGETYPCRPSHTEAPDGTTGTGASTDRDVYLAYPDSEIDDCTGFLTGTYSVVTGVTVACVSGVLTTTVTTKVVTVTCGRIVSVV